MRLFLQTFCLCLALLLTNAAPTHHDGMMQADPAQVEEADGKPDRCDGIEFDAITPDEKGNTFFFKDDHLWKGFRGPAQLSNESFQELDDQHTIGHVDAAFRMHNKDNLDDHDHIYFFLDDKVFSYYNHILEEGYPKEIQQDFPGVPSHLDAAVECPKGECSTDSVLFFKGEQVYNYDIPTKVVKEKHWPHLPNCTSAFRWLEHYYCFHGNNFTRFQPVTGDVVEGYPKDTRDYFMKCDGFGHGRRTTKKPKCSDISLNAITSDNSGKSYAFIGNYYMRLDTHRDGTHAFPITRTWKEVTNTVNAVFSYSDKMYIIAGGEVFIYKSAAHYTLIEGYPKPLKEELGIEGQVDAAFVCPADQNTVHIIQGQNMLDIDLSATPRKVSSEAPLPVSGINAAVCGPEGIRVFVGSVFYHFESARVMAFSRMRPKPHKITWDMFSCEED